VGSREKKRREGRTNRISKREVVRNPYISDLGGEENAKK